MDLHGLLRRERLAVRLIAAQVEGDPASEGFFRALCNQEVGRLSGFVGGSQGELIDRVVLLRSLDRPEVMDDSTLAARLLGRARPTT